MKPLVEKLEENERDVQRLTHRESQSTKKFECERKKVDGKTREINKLKEYVQELEERLEELQERDGQPTIQMTLASPSPQAEAASPLAAATSRSGRLLSIPEQHLATHVTSKCTARRCQVLVLLIKHEEKIYGRIKQGGKYDGIHQCVNGIGLFVLYIYVFFPFPMLTLFPSLALPLIRNRVKKKVVALCAVHFVP